MAEVEVSDAGWRNESFREDAKGRLFVFFYDKQVKHTAKSKETGRPIFTTKTMIKKLVPADPRLVIDTYASEKHFEDFPVEYARYQQKKENRPEGTPLEAWPLLSDTQKAEFRAINLFTVEQLANLPDSASDKIMGLVELRKKARAFVMAQEAGEKLVLAEEREKEQAKIIADLSARLASLETAPKRKPGRPRKEPVIQAA